MREGESFYLDSNNTVHHLKVRDPYFRDLVKGLKTFELRKNDRDYHIGDLLILHEYDALRQEHTGFVLVALVTYIIEGEWLAEGYVALGIRILR